MFGRTSYERASVAETCITTKYTQVSRPSAQSTDTSAATPEATTPQAPPTPLETTAIVHKLAHEQKSKAKQAGNERAQRESKHGGLVREFLVIADGET